MTVTLRSKADCVGDPQLEEFRCERGPAAGEVQLIVRNLIEGEALPQTVALLREERSGDLLGIASVRLDGNAQIRAKASEPWFLRRLAPNPYVNLVARDERFRNHVLNDGRTRLGEAIVRAALEVVEQARYGRPMPTIWALVRRDNAASKRAFRAFAFYPHDRSQESQQDVFVRRAGRALPPAPDPRAYRSLQRSGAHQHLSA
ncbi:MAG: hypothetical protein ACLQBB_13375 [Solirubrobacteraceae bacterium]